MTPRSFALLAALIGIAAAFGYFYIKPALFVMVLSLAGLAVFHVSLTDSARRDLGSFPAILAVLMPLTAWSSPNIWWLYAIVIAIVPILARCGGQVAALYLFALLLLPALDQSVAIGALRLFDFGVHDALAVGATLFLVVNPRRRAAPRRALDVPFALVLVFLILALSRDTSITNASRVATNLVLDCALPYYIVSRGVRDRADVHRCMVHLAAAAAIVSVILVYEVWRSWPIYNILVDQYALPERLVVKSRGGVLRAGGSFLEPTSAAMVLVFCFLAAWMARSSFRSRAHHAVLLTLLLIGLIAPQSRGAWLGLLTGVVMIELYLRRYRLLTLRLGGLVLLGSAVLALAHINQRVSEALGMSGQAIETVDYRQRLFDRGLEELAHSPLIGFSRPEIVARLDDLRQGEGIVDFVNTHLYLALIGGVIGLFVFDGAFVFYIVHVWRARRVLRDDAEAMRAAAFTFAVLITPLQMLAFTSLGGRVQSLLFVFFAFATVRRVAAPLQPITVPIQPPSFAFVRHPAAMPMPAASSSNASSPAWNNPMR